MDEATTALFPHSFKETELGAVPRGWELPYSEVPRLRRYTPVKRGNNHVTSQHNSPPRCRQSGSRPPLRGSTPWGKKEGPGRGYLIMAYW